VLIFDASPQRNGTVLDEHYAFARAKTGDLLNSVVSGVVMGDDHSRCGFVDCRLKRSRREMRRTGFDIDEEGRTPSQIYHIDQVKDSEASQYPFPPTTLSNRVLARNINREPAPRERDYIVDTGEAAKNLFKMAIVGIVERVRYNG